MSKVDINGGPAPPKFRFLCEKCEWGTNKVVPRCKKCSGEMIPTGKKVEDFVVSTKTFMTT